MIISIGEARKLLGKKESDQLTDEQVEELIDQLDWLARVAIDSYRKDLDSKRVPPTDS